MYYPSKLFKFESNLTLIFKIFRLIPENKKRRGKCNKTQLQFYEC
jgi:hypothetical protein